MKIVINKLNEELAEEGNVAKSEKNTYLVELKESIDGLKALDAEILRLILDEDKGDSCDKNGSRIWGVQ